jgi:hypothetical protein
MNTLYYGENLKILAVIEEMAGGVPSLFLEVIEHSRDRADLEILCRRNRKACTDAELPMVAEWQYLDARETFRTFSPRLIPDIV